MEKLRLIKYPGSKYNYIDMLIDMKLERDLGRF